MLDSVYQIEPEGIRSKFSKRKMMLLQLLQSEAISRDIYKFIMLICKKADNEDSIICKQRDLCDELGVAVSALKKSQDISVALKLISVERSALHQNKITLNL